MQLHSCLYHALFYFLDSHQMVDRANHTANLGSIIMNHRSVQFPQPKSPDGSLLGFLSVDRASYLSNFQPGHVTVSLLGQY